MNRTQRAILKQYRKEQASLLVMDTEEKDAKLTKVKSGMASAFVTKSDYSASLKEANHKVKERKADIRRFKKSVLSENYAKELVRA